MFQDILMLITRHLTVIYNCRKILKEMKTTTQLALESVCRSGSNVLENWDTEELDLFTNRQGYVKPVYCCQRYQLYGVHQENR